MSDNRYLTQRRPPHRPMAGLCLPVELVRLRDADTIEVSLPHSSYRWAIRLIDCWAPENHQPGGPEATAYAERLLRASDQLYIYIPPPQHPQQLLKDISFDRLPGYIYIDDRTTLNDALVSAGFATSSKTKGS